MQITGDRKWQMMKKKNCASAGVGTLSKRAGMGPGTHSVWDITQSMANQNKRQITRVLAFFRQETGLAKGDLWEVKIM
jgi:hypothetical protein